MKKKVKRKFNLKKFLSFILFICIIVFFGVILLRIKLKNIIILGNQYYNDETIIEKANLEKYPKFILLNKSKIKNSIMKLELVEDVIIKKEWGFILRIEIKEKKVLYLTRSSNKYRLSDGNEYDSDNELGVPLLINFIPSDIEKLFISEFSKIDKDIISLISEIEYAKTDFDTKRFKFYMNDGNLIYVNTNRMKSFNKYIDIVTKLDNKKGILYLDSGNYFEIKEN